MNWAARLAVPGVPLHTQLILEWCSLNLEKSIVHEERIQLCYDPCSVKEQDIEVRKFAEIRDVDAGVKVQGANLVERESVLRVSGADDQAPSESTQIHLKSVSNETHAVKPLRVYCEEVHHGLGLISLSRSTPRIHFDRQGRSFGTLKIESKFSVSASTAQNQSVNKGDEARRRDRLCNATHLPAWQHQRSMVRAKGQLPREYFKTS
ncbi:hypothetical protein B0H16DRAFT_1460977 [Mycena metata]|uniref:Uncharacterized protein n=1 Tax=Mycena metata TaxID=1033252 RepID=A0AAD7IUY3_9AGAR|nr:hypothetical protein B0H16DRAFT_1460977 [Mycena metata]